MGHYASPPFPSWLPCSTDSCYTPPSPPRPPNAFWVTILFPVLNIETKMRFFLLVWYDSHSLSPSMRCFLWKWGTPHQGLTFIRNIFQLKMKESEIVFFGGHRNWKRGRLFFGGCKNWKRGRLLVWWLQKLQRCTLNFNLWLDPNSQMCHKLRARRNSLKNQNPASKFCRYQLRHSIQMSTGCPKKTHFQNVAGATVH